MSFEGLELHEKLLRAVEASGFTEPTDIQREAIPIVNAGRDLMASAQTGTGKTAAFVLPALQRLLEPAAKSGVGPRVLVLTPTRELAVQINDNIRQLGRFCKFTNGSVIGGMSYGPQLKLLKQPLDLLVATPGRLMDLMQQGMVNFSRLEILVLDEADRMLDMGFIDAVKKIAAATPAKKQTLLFSATLEGKILAVAKQLLDNPARVQLASNQESHALIVQRMHRVDNGDHKRNLLAHYLNSDDLHQAVIFTATKRGADRLAKTISGQGHASAALHGDMGQGKRKRTVDSMRRGKVKFLVATDVAARGLDIRGISHVINFDLPMVAEDYIHRIGRTGRCGTHGHAVSLVSHEDWEKLADIEKLTGKKLSRDTIPGLEPTTPTPTGAFRPAKKRKSFSAKRGNAKQGPKVQYRGGPRRRNEGRAASN